jgi:hypothetical protein
MKVIFLDIDGVLNVISQGHDKYGAIFHYHFIENLEKIIIKTNAKIVISSTWRSSGLKQMQSMWKDRHLAGDVIGITPYRDDRHRGKEIQEYIDVNNIDKYVIIDDDSDMLKSQRKYFVKTSENQDHPDCIDVGYGLTNICTEKVIEILNK